MSWRFLVFSGIVWGLSAVACVQAVTRTFTGADSGDWSDPNNWSPAGVPVAGDTVNDSSGTLMFDYDYGTSTQLGTVSVGDGVTYYQSSGTLNSTGFGLDGTGYISGGAVQSMDVGFGGTCTLSGNATIASVGGGPDMAFEGTFYQKGGSITCYNGITNDGEYYLSAGSIDGDEWANNGMVVQTGGSAQGVSSVSIGGTYYLEGGSIDAPQISVVGTVFYQSGGTVGDFSGALSVEGNYFMTGGSVMEYMGIVSQSGNFAQSNGSVGISVLQLYSGAHYSFSGGELYVLSSLYNSGNLSIDVHPNPESSPNKIVAASLYENASATLSLLDLVPGDPAPLHCIGSASLGGVLETTLNAGYTPSMGDTFLLISAETISGTFSTYDFPTLPAGMYFQPLYTPTEMELVIFPEPNMVTALPAIASCLVGLRRRARR